MQSEKSNIAIRASALFSRACDVSIKPSIIRCAEILCKDWPNAFGRVRAYTPPVNKMSAEKSRWQVPSRRHRPISGGSGIWERIERCD
jgi:hypothetical protein